MCSIEPYTNLLYLCYHKNYMNTRMMQTYKFRLYPNKEQAVLLHKTFGCTRFIYNQILRVRINNYEAKKNHLEVSNKLTPAKFKEEFPWLKDVDSLALANAQLHVQRAYKNKFESNFGTPKFKSKHARQSYTTNNQKGSIRLSGNKIKLPKIGYVNIKLHRNVLGNIKSCTISMNKSGKYYISILTDYEFVHKKKVKNIIGVDLGIKDFATLSNDEKIHNPNLYRNSEKRIKKLQKTLSRRIKNSKNRYKAKIALAKLHEKIANRRNDFLQKLSTKLINENQVICLEDLQVNNMIKNHKLAKSIQDCSWSNLVAMLEYKASRYGRTIIKVNRWYPSSKLCSHCGYKMDEMPLTIREWTCPKCGIHHDRDVNASINILQEGIKIMNGRNDQDSLLILSSLEDTA